MTILPSQPPGPARRAPNVPWQYVAIVLVVVIAVVVAFVVWQGGGSSSPATAPAVATTGGQSAAPQLGAAPNIPAQRMVTLARRSLKRTKWGHSKVQIVGSNSNTETEDIRGGPHVQTELDTFDGHVARVVTIRKVAYVYSDAFYLQYIDNFPAAVAQLAAGQWVRLVAGDPPYRSVTQNSDGGAALPLHGPYTVVGTTERDGQQTIEVQGFDGKRQHVRHVTVYLEDSRSYMPLEYDEVGQVKEVTITVTAQFSDFGKHVRVTAPSHSTSWRQLESEAA